MTDKPDVTNVPEYLVLYYGKSEYAHTSVRFWLLYAETDDKAEALSEYRMALDCGSPACIVCTSGNFFQPVTMPPA